jgi:hypothetical protein
MRNNVQPYIKQTENTPAGLVIILLTAIFLGGCQDAHNYPGTYSAVWILIGIGIILGIIITVRRVLRRRQGKDVAEQRGTNPTGDNSGYDPSTGK